MDLFDDVVFPFEDVGESLALLPLAARRALDVAGLRLSLEGYQSLSVPERRDLALFGMSDQVDTPRVERLVRKSSMPPTRIKPIADPDPRIPPEQLNAALGVRRSVDPLVWAKLRAIERYALIHVMRRSIAHDDPGRLESAASALLPRPKVGPGKLEEHRSPSLRADPRTSDLPSPRRLDAGSRGYDEGPGPTRASTPPSDRTRGDLVSQGALDLDLSRGSIPMALMPSSLFEDRESPPPEAALISPVESWRPVTHPPPSEGQSASAPRSGHPSLPPPDFVSTHLDEAGHVRMVDVGEKSITLRRAAASGSVRMRVETAERLSKNDTPKGDVLASARVAGIMAAKRTPDLIPLCHQVAVTKVEVEVEVEVGAGLLTVTAVVEAVDRTGVEMEALTAVSVACLTVYDMLKGIDRDLVIGDIKLLSKTGGRTGPYVRKQR